MGTNYYAEIEACDCCRRGENRKHIGKSSSGWVFSLRIYPSEGINNLTDWLRILCRDDVIIKNEYGQEIPIHVMIDTIVNRSHPKGLQGGGSTDGTYSYNAYEFS